MLYTGRDLVAVEFTEIKDEVFGDGGSVQGVAVEVHCRVRAVGALAENRYEQGEVFRPQQKIRAVHDADDPRPAPRDLAAEVVQAVDQGIPVSAEVAGEAEGFRESAVDPCSVASSRASKWWTRPPFAVSSDSCCRISAVPSGTRTTQGSEVPVRRKWSFASRTAVEIHPSYQRRPRRARQASPTASSERSHQYSSLLRTADRTFHHLNHGGRSRKGTKVSVSLMAYSAKP